MKSMEKTEGSIYSPLMEGEIERLALQARLTKKADEAPIAYLKEIYKNQKCVYVLDVGCGYGTVARDRFADWDNVFVVGLDFQEGALEVARQLNSDVDNYVFEQANIDSPELETRMSEIMQKYGIDGFDIVFGAYIVQHIAAPITFLKRCRAFIKDGGYILLRNTADKSTISYGDDGLVKAIQDKTEFAPGNASRDLGLKLHHHLYVSGYQEIKMYGWMKDISNMTEQERMEVFAERFSWRTTYFKNALEKDPTNESLRADYEWMVAALEKLAAIFKEPSFWYGETIINALAKK